MNSLRIKAIALGVLALFALTAFADEDRDWSALQASTSYSKNGTQGCLKCHETEHENAILAGPHGMVGDSRTPAANKGCESCHGPGGEHSDKEKQFRVAQTFMSTDPADSAEKSGVCFACHQEFKAQRHWLTSEHSANDISCMDCHTPHERVDRIRERSTQAQVCVGCHTDQKANMFKYSRHPVREGKVVCADCHNTHGAKGPNMLVASTVNEVCYNCHAEKRGPFLFEHEPAQDDCTNCHNPHGSVNDQLLTSRPPFLCQQCHVDSRHPGTIYANDVGPISGTPPSGNSRVIARGCTNCHTQVHGSNHPAAWTKRR